MNLIKMYFMIVSEQTPVMLIFDFGVCSSSKSWIQFFPLLIWMD